jgi:hypothetical protein
MATTIKLINKMNQGLNILLKTEKGKMVSAVIPARGFREINESEMSQDVADKAAKKYILIETKVDAGKVSDKLGVGEGAKGPELTGTGVLSRSSDAAKAGATWSGRRY